MTTHAPTTASPPAAALDLDLDAKMAITLAVMGERCTLALLAFDINTAHLPAADPVPAITEVVPLTPTLAPAPSSYGTPIAALLDRTRTHIEQHGWLRGQLRDDHMEKRCVIGAIRIQAADRNQADKASALLLEAIRRDLPDATVPSWNDAQTSVEPVLAYIAKAAQIAHARSL